MFTQIDTKAILSTPLNLTAELPLDAIQSVSDYKHDTVLCDSLNKIAISPASSGQRLISCSGNEFLILDELGTGGQGIVYRAFSQTDNQIVAIKLLSNSNNNDITNFLSTEANMLARLNHPNIVKVLEYGILTDGRPYMVMEYIKAETLDCLLRRCGRLPKEQAANICLQIANAMEHAHQRGVVHRDLKPRNILVANIDGKDFVTVLDFGISFVVGESIHCAENKIYGSVFYLSPEQLTNEEISARSDIYQLGLIFFECMLGCLPFEPSFAAAIEYRFAGKVFSHSAQAELAPATTSILKKALAHNPKHRQLSMAEFALQIIDIKVGCYPASLCHVITSGLNQLRFLFDQENLKFC